MITKNKLTKEQNISLISSLITHQYFDLIYIICDGFTDCYETISKIAIRFVEYEEKNKLDYTETDIFQEIDKFIKDVNNIIG